MNAKKIGLIILLIFIIAIAGVVIVNASTNDSSDTNSDESSEETVETVDLEIGSDYFVTNMNDIYLNYADYEGKTISYKGMVYHSDDIMTVVRFYYCCGYDYSLVGLECNYDDEIDLADGQWVQVTGKIEIETDDTGYTYPILNITTLKKVEGSDDEMYVST